MMVKAIYCFKGDPTNFIQTRSDAKTFMFLNFKK